MCEWDNVEADEGQKHKWVGRNESRLSEIIFWNAHHAETFRAGGNSSAEEIGFQE